MICYLSNGDISKIRKLRSTGENDLRKYYLLNRAKDLNNLLDYIAYLKYLKKLDVKNAGKT
jgi:hypothetical protein